MNKKYRHNNLQSSMFINVINGQIQWTTKKNNKSCVKYYLQLLLKLEKVIIWSVPQKMSSTQKKTL